jgi:hypothetical protein
VHLVCWMGMVFFTGSFCIRLEPDLNFKKIWLERKRSARIISHLTNKILLPIKLTVEALSRKDATLYLAQIAYFKIQRIKSNIFALAITG